MIQRLDHGVGDSSGMRAFNRNLILNVIRQHRALPKAEIARATGLSAQSASVIVNELLKDRLVRKEKKIRGKVGQPVTPISLNPAGAYSVGIKIGRRNLEVVLVDFNGDTVRYRQIDYRAPIRAHVFSELHETLDGLLGSLDDRTRERIIGIGVAMPGQFNEWAPQIGLDAHDLDDWLEVDVCADLTSRYGFGCTLFNDAAAACAAEMELGQAITARSTLYIYAGTFIGGGIVLDGRLYQGNSMNAGAVASMPFGKDRKQVLECASLIFLDESLRRSGIEYEVFTDALSLPTARPLVEDWLDRAAEGIAHIAVSAAAVIDFEGIVIDGILPADLVDLLVGKVNSEIAGFNLTGLSEFTIAPGTIGRSASALGAAVLPIIRRFAPGQELLAKPVKAAE